MMIARQRRQSWMTWALVLLCVSVLAIPAAAQSQPDDVERVLAAFLIPFSNGNVAEFIDYFAEDATLFMPPTAPGASPDRVQGKAAIAREFQALFGRFTAPPGGQRTTIRPQDLNVQRFSDFAVVTFHLGTDASRGRRTFVLRRTEQEWRILHLHASTVLPPSVAR
jgi:ketosteroid isomerase-like protein